MTVFDAIRVDAPRALEAAARALRADSVSPHNQKWFQGYARQAEIVAQTLRGFDGQDLSRAEEELRRGKAYVGNWIRPQRLTFVPDTEEDTAVRAVCASAQRACIGVLKAIQATRGSRMQKAMKQVMRASEAANAAEATADWLLNGGLHSSASPLKGPP